MFAFQSILQFRRVEVQNPTYLVFIGLTMSVALLVHSARVFRAPLRLTAWSAYPHFPTDTRVFPRLSDRVGRRNAQGSLGNERSATHGRADLSEPRSLRLSVEYWIFGNWGCQCTGKELPSNTEAVAGCHYERSSIDYLRPAGIRREPCVGCGSRGSRCRNETGHTQL